MIDLKKSRLITLALLLVTVLFVQESLAQDYIRWGLSDGALARIGKGSIGGGSGDELPVAYSPDGKWIAVGSSTGIWLYDAHTGAEVALLTGHTGGASAVAFSPDGKTLAMGHVAGYHTPNP